MKDTTTYLFEQILAGRVDRNIGVELLTRLKREHTLQTAEMAVIGMSVRLPHARTPDQFWQNLRAGIDSIGPLPPRRRQDEDRYLEALGKLSHDYELGAYLEEIDAFDYRFFRLTPKEASLMSPAQRLFLESAWETIEEAGYGGNQLRGSKTGVYIGYGSDALHDYMQMIQTVEPNAVSMAVPGNLSPIVASRIAYLLDLRGPSMAIDTTCSSSLVALHVACQAIRNGDCEQALVGGIRINYLRQKGELRMGIQASDGRAKTFDDSSDGTGSGEGVVAVLIKPLDKALHDGDQIHAVIKGSAINQDGNSIGLTAPNVLAQEQLLLDAWQAAGVSPETITYLEAHGTGTKLGDPIEIDALRKAFRRHTARTQFCGIGSVKTNVGHLDNAAGLVGLIKTILALKHGELPPSLHFMKANRQIRFEDSPVYVVDRLMPWATDGIPRRAGISSFGLSGTNCHVVLEEAPKRAKTRKEEEKIWLLPLSAKTKSGLAALKEQYRHRLMSGEHLSLPDLCQTAALGRGQYEHRMAILASSRADLLAKLSGGEGVYSSSALMLQKSDTEGPDVDGWLARWIMERQGEAREQLLVELGILYVQGADIPWNLVYQDEVWNKASLPVYPFERTRCWIDIPINLSKKEQGIAMSQAYESAAIKHGETVLAFVKQTVQDITGISEAEISAEHNLFEMGLDSLMLVQVSERIKDHYGLEIPLGEFYEELSTPGALAAYLTEHLPAQSPDALVDYQASVVSVHNTPVQQVLSNPVAPDVTQAARNLPPAGGSDLERLLAQQLQVMSMQLELLSKPSQDMTKAQTAFLQTAATATASPVQQIRDEGDTGSTEPDQGVFIPYRKLALTPSTMSEQQLRHVEELAARLSERFKLTKEMTQKFRRVLANNRNVAGFKPAWKEMIVQVIAERAQGSKIWDVDGREYLDISMGFGVHLLGHAPSFITEAVREEALRGMPLGPMNPLAGEVAQLISEFTGMERIAFFNSGTEAVMVALRLARAVTGRSKIALFEGSFHGTFDGVLARRHSAGGVQAVPVAPGITDHLVGDVVVLKYNDPESLEIIKRHAHELAGVLVEPVQSRRPDLQPREFLQELRQVTKERDIALIFDEIITGFRIHPGGAQAWFGVQADIATYGKIMGGGLPVGVVAGKSKYMNSIDGGDWQYGDDSYPQSDRTRTLVGGTFCHHPLAMAAIRAMLDHLRAEGAVVQERINVRTTRLVTTLNEYFEQTEVPIKMVHFGSLFRFVLSGDLELLFYHLLDNGIYVWEGRNCFLSSAHTDGDVDRLINAVINSVEAMREGGFLPKLTQAKERDASSIERIPFTEGQRNLWLHTQIGHQESMAYNEYVILDLDGPLHTKALRGAVQKIVQRHEILRATRVDEHGFLLEASPAIDIQVVDFTAFTEAEQADRLRDWLESKAQHPIDLESLLMFRLYLLKQGPTRHQLVIILPHLMADGWSTAVLLGELEAIYREGCTHIPVSLPEPVQFREYVEWLAERQGGSEGEEMVLYWREQFAEPIPPLDLPLDLPRPVQRSFSGARLRIKVGAPLLESLKKFSRHQGCSLFHTLFGVFQLFLYRLTGQNRFVIGIPTAGQVDMPKNYLVGQCANVLPFVCQVEGGDAFAHLLQKVKHDSASAMKNQHVAVSSLAKGTTIPDVQVMFNLDRQVGKPQLYGIKTDMVAYPIQYVKYELTLNAVEVDGDMLLDFDYKTELFYSESVQRWTAQFLSLLEQIVASPGVLHDEFELDGEPPQFLSESRKGKDGGDLALANALNISQEDRLTLADSLLPTDRESLIRIARAAGAEEGPADVSTVYAVPVSALQDGALYLPSHAIRWLAIGNERLSGSDINSFRERLAPGSSVTVLYRPDELAQFVAVHEVGDALLHPLETVPFGRALPGVSLVALQHTGRPAPLGVYGDLYAILPGQGEELRSLGIRGRRLTADLFGRELQCQERQLLGGKAVSDTERRLLTFWQEVLGIPDIGVHDHFFELGGQSFKAAQIIGRIREEWGNDLSLLTIFEHPTVFKLARFIDRSTARERPPIMPIRSKERYVASSAQKRQYILNQLDPSSTAYHLTAAFRLSGHLDRNALEYALQQVVHRHESLRTSFHFDDGECWQIVHDDISLRLEEGDGEEGDIHRMANSFLRPFDLGTAPLMRARLVTVGDETHVLFLDLHHIIADGLSVNILFRDLLSSWKGRALQPLELQSKDFAEWQQTLLESEFGQEQEAYWLSQFAGELPLLKLPTDFPRPANKSYEGACHAFSFDSQLSKALQELALKTDSTLFMVLLAAFQVLLAKFTMQEDIIVGSPVAGRPTAQTEGVIGMFVNTVPLRGRPHAARTFRDFLQEVKGTCLDAFDNQEYPLERLVERLGLPRDTSRNPLFDTLFVFDNMGSVQAELHDLKIEPVKLDGRTAQFDLALHTYEEGSELRFTLEYATKLFQTSTAERIARHFTQVVRSLTAQPDKALGELQMIDEKETNLILNQFNSTAVAYDQEETVHGLFEKMARAYPDAPAAIFDTQTLCYGELNEKAGQLARVLRTKGVGPDQPVGIMTDRSPEMIIGIL
ncbi:aminotransferase class III-fold pyridoxal phosphate-dependent enzyme, partial [Brevibacillus brevis]